MALVCRFPGNSVFRQQLAAAASHRQALALFRDLGNVLGQAEALNRLGELATRTSATGQARERHTQALAIAQETGAPLEQARALEGLGQARLQDGNPGQAAAQLRQALAIYQRIGAPGAQRVRETLRQYGLEQPSHQPAHDQERVTRRWRAPHHL